MTDPELDILFYVRKLVDMIEQNKHTLEQEAVVQKIIELEYDRRKLFADCNNR